MARHRTESATKIDHVVAKTLQVWEANRDNEYETSFNSGVVAERRGALQIIFCDLGPPPTTPARR